MSNEPHLFDENYPRRFHGVSLARLPESDLHVSLSLDKLLERNKLDPYQNPSGHLLADISDWVRHVHQRHVQVHVLHFCLYS